MKTAIVKSWPDPVTHEDGSESKVWYHGHSGAEYIVRGRGPGKDQIEVVVRNPKRISFRLHRPRSINYTLGANDYRDPDDPDYIFREFTYRYYVRRQDVIIQDQGAQRKQAKNKRNSRQF